jgi:hypothetical protein
LLRDPLQRVVAVVLFLCERTKNAARLIPASHILHHDGIAAVEEYPIVGDQRPAFAVGRADENDRERQGGALRAEYMGA